MKNVIFIMKYSNQNFKFVMIKLTTFVFGESLYCDVLFPNIWVYSFTNSFQV